ncbi:MAG TPA: DUF2505 domain-containing protein [Sporichthyaceae bacterium]|jgi:hypothetical protein|nr:DUF2505 domain-containing protein [Sporichthyaceae bacterium]
MKFHHEMNYDAPAPAVFRMLTDPDFQAQRAKAGNPEQADSSVVVAPDGEVIITVHRLMAVQLPGMLQRLTGDKIRIVETQTWHPSDLEADEQTGRLQAGLTGQPGGVEGTLHLAGDQHSTDVVVDAEIKVNVPLVGGKIEGFIAEMLIKFLTKEEEIGRAWLGGGGDKR